MPPTLVFLHSFWTDVDDVDVVSPPHPFFPRRGTDVDWNTMEVRSDSKPGENIGERCLAPNDAKGCERL